jgi:hypothetical protein
MTIHLEAREADQEAWMWMQSLRGSRTLRVQAIYGHALYAVVESRLVVLLSQEEPVGPTSVVVTASHFDATWQATGRVTGGVIQIGPRVISLQRARPRDCTMASVDHVESETITHLVERIWGTGDIWSHMGDGKLRGRLEHAVNALFEGLQADDTEGLQTVVASLIGLGEGSTPTGDDLLVGMIAGLAISRPRWAEQVRRAIPLVATLQMQTTWPSVVALSAVAQGRVFSLINETIQWLAAPDFAHDDCVARLAQRGHTSGRDLLAGLVIGTTEHL